MLRAKDSDVPKRRLILLEFNELCPSLLKHWMDEGRLPNFKAFHDASQVFVASADTTKQDQLEPWIQWYSIHTGLDVEQHGVSHLTDGPAAGHLDVWRILLEAGYTVACCSSMNAKGFASPGSMYLPDPWCVSEPSHPPELEAFHRVVRTKVQENTNAAMGSAGRSAYLSLLRFLVGHGLRPGTVLATLRQLASEPLSGGKTAWRKVVLLDRLQFDVFKHYWDINQYDFSSFFLNSTAHYQHAYWHLAFPESFPHSFDPDARDDPRRGAILYGYRMMDRMLGQFRSFEERGAIPVLCTALSQQPNPEAGRAYYRPRDASSLLRRLGIRPEEILPVMAQQFSIRFPTARGAEQARAALRRVTHEGRAVFQFSTSPETFVFFGVPSGSDVSKDARLDVDGESVPFHDIFYKIPHTKAGIHHPDSALWFKTGTHKVHSHSPSILDIMPTLLDYYGVATPHENGLIRKGRSLLPEMELAP